MPILAEHNPTPNPDPTHDRCPGGCAELISAQLHVLAERVADVVTLPTLPRLMLICSGCQRTFVIAPPLARKAAGS